MEYAMGYPTYYFIVGEEYEESGQYVGCGWPRLQSIGVSEFMNQWLAIWKCEIDNNCIE